MDPAEALKAVGLGTALARGDVADEGSGRAFQRVPEELA